MAEQHRVRRLTDYFRYQGPERHGPELAINEGHLMVVVDQRPAYA